MSISIPKFAQVRRGLLLVYFSVLLLLLQIVLMCIGLPAGMRLPPGTPPPLTTVGAVLSILYALFLLVGLALCLTIPAETRAKAYVGASFALALLAVLATAVFHLRGDWL